MTIALFLGLIFSVIFFRVAEYEHMSPWTWSVASLGLSGIITLRGGTIALLFPAQVGLFVLMWWYNIRRRMSKSD